jgi:hypothetical protein
VLLNTRVLPVGLHSIHIGLVPCSCCCSVTYDCNSDNPCREVNQRYFMQMLRMQFRISCVLV